MAKKKNSETKIEEIKTQAPASLDEALSEWKSDEEAEIVASTPEETPAIAAMKSSPEEEEIISASGADDEAEIMSDEETDVISVSDFARRAREEAEEIAASAPPEEITYIDDPFQFMPSVVSASESSEEEISAEDLPDEELILVDSAEVDAQIEVLATSMKSEHEKTVQELEEILAQEKVQAEDELKKQIAEDIALEAELKAEAEIQEEPPEVLEALPTFDDNGVVNFDELQSCLESLTFMSDKALSVKRALELLQIEGLTTEQVKTGFAHIQARYRSVPHGIELVEVAGGYQFRTKPIRAPLASRMSKVQTHKLSRGAMESLAIIAYKQPVMKDEIDKIRGVDSSHFIRGLLEKKLIGITGRSELPGRPILYGTTVEFLEIFGLRDLDQLPPLREIESMIPSSENLTDENDPKLQAIRKLVSQMSADKTRIAYDPKEDEKFLTEIREKVSGISTTTPTLEKQDSGEDENTTEEPVGQMDLASTSDLPTAEEAALARSITAPEGNN